MVSDDLYNLPRDFLEHKLHHHCMFFNHSCDPNCGLNSLDSALLIAIRDIEVSRSCFVVFLLTFVNKINIEQIDEEVTLDYQFWDIEIDYLNGTICKCGSKKCRGIIHFDYYRNVDWQNKFYKYCSGHIRKKIDELRTKWYSSSCFLKYYKNNENDTRRLGLTALENIRKKQAFSLINISSLFIFYLFFLSK